MQMKDLQVTSEKKGLGSKGPQSQFSDLSPHWFVVRNFWKFFLGSVWRLEMLSPS